MKHVFLCTILALVGCGGNPPPDVPSPPTMTPAGVADFSYDLKAVSATMDKSLWPTSVPRDYLLMPSGFMHPACVFELREGEYTSHDATTRTTQIHRADGSVREEHGACAYPSYAAGGLVQVIGEQPAVRSPTGGAHPNVQNGYQVKADYYSPGQNVGHVFSKWVVPSAPPAGGAGIQIFIWNGIQGVHDLYQPYLFINNSNTWGFRASVNEDGNGYFGGIFWVSPGDAVEGETALSGGYHYEYLWRNGSYLGYTAFGGIDSYNNDAIFAAAEVYFATSCQQWPGLIGYGGWNLLDTEKFTDMRMCYGAGCTAIAPPSIATSICIDSGCNTGCGLASSTEYDWSWHN